jgi:hypothetical protein
MFQALFNNFAAACQPAKAILGLPTWYKYLNGEFVAGRCSPIVDFTTHPNDLARIVLAVVEIMLRVAGLVAIGYVIYGGFRYILSQGEMGPSNVPKTVIARHTIVNALIGLVIASLATFIVQLVAKNLT